MFKLLLAVFVVYNVAWAKPLDENQPRVPAELQANKEEETLVHTRQVAGATQAQVTGCVPTQLVPLTEQDEVVIEHIPVNPQENHDVVEEDEDRRPAVKKIIDYLGQAWKLTFLEEKHSIDKALQSIKEASSHGLEAGLNAAQTGFDIFLIAPKFGKNILNPTKKTET